MPFDRSRGGDPEKDPDPNRNAGYPRYKSMIVQVPSEADFSRAWTRVFGFSFQECEVSGLEGVGANGENIGLTVKTPDGRSIMHGGFGEHTDQPQIGERDFYYSGCGCPWDTDENGVRYHLIDLDTNLPVDFEKVVAVEIIRRFVEQQG